MVTHPGKLETMKVGSKHSIEKAGKIDMVLKEHRLKEVSSYNYLGVYVDSSMNWSKQVNIICKKIYPKLKLLNRLSSFLSSDVLLKIYKVTVLPIFDDGCIVWMNCTKKLFDKLERLQSQVLRIILQKDRKTCSKNMRLNTTEGAICFSFWFLKSWTISVAQNNSKINWKSDQKCTKDV